MKALTKIILCNIFMSTTFVDVFTSTVKGYSVATTFFFEQSMINLF